MNKTYKKINIIKRALYYGLHKGRLRMGDKMKYNQIILPDTFPNLCNKKYLGRRGSTNTYYINDRDIEERLIELSKILTGIEFSKNGEKDSYTAYFYYIVQTEEEITQLNFTQSYICHSLSGFWFEVYNYSKEVDFIKNIHLTTKIKW